MSKALESILLGTWSPPEGKVTTRRHLVMKGTLLSNITQAIKESDAQLDTELEVLRFLREFRPKWFSPTEIHSNIKTKFSVGGLGNILKSMVNEQFIRVEYKSKNRKIALYQFNGEDK